jgi:glycosyltransferase involved in cell wall biosynthesis
MMQPRKTILVNFIVSPRNTLTGISVYTFKILEELVRRNEFNYVLLTNWDVGAIPRCIHELGVSILQTRTAKSEKLAFPHSIWLSYRASLDTAADLIFTPHPYGAFLGARARVMVIHDLYRQTNPQDYRWDRRLSWNAFLGMTVARSTAIICVSTATRTEFERYYPAYAHKAVVIHEASPIKRLEHSPSSCAALEPYGLVVANATANKNIGCVLSALALLREQGIGVRIYWIGRDEFGHVARLRKAHPGLDNFVPLGSLDESQLRAYYANARFFLNSSTTEGFCLPVLEAQTFGVPVICSDIPVLREVAGEGALFFNPYSPSQLAGQIRLLTADEKLRTRLVEKASSNVLKFSWADAASKTQSIFATCLGI